MFCMSLVLLVLSVEEGRKPRFHTPESHFMNFKMKNKPKGSLPFQFNNSKRVTRKYHR